MTSSGVVSGATVEWFSRRSGERGYDGACDEPWRAFTVRYIDARRVRRTSVDDAAALLGLKRRQVVRLLDRMRAEGAAGLISRKRGKPSNRRHSAKLREQIIAIVREHYADFGPTLAREYLIERHGVTVSCETLRQLMIEAGLSISLPIILTDLAVMRLGGAAEAESCLLTIFHWGGLGLVGADASATGVRKECHQCTKAVVRAALPFTLSFFSSGDACQRSVGSKAMKSARL